MRKNVLAFVGLATLAACMGFGDKYKYDGPATATEQQFANVLYNCAQDTSNPVTVGGLSRMGVNYREESLPSCGMLKACLRSKGYYQDDEGRFNSKEYSVKCTE